MEVTNILNISTRADLYRWFLDNHDKVSDFWIRVNRANADYPGVIRYADAVEVALCFGWIDSTLKRIDEGKPVQRFTPRRKGGNWCERNLERCRRLIENGEMTPAGLAVIPDLLCDMHLWRWAGESGSGIVFSVTVGVILQVMEAEIVQYLALELPEIDSLFFYSVLNIRRSTRV